MRIAANACTYGCSITGICLASSNQKFGFNKGMDAVNKETQFGQNRCVNFGSGCCLACCKSELICASIKSTDARTSKYVSVKHHTDWNQQLVCSTAFYLPSKERGATMREKPLHFVVPPRRIHISIVDQIWLLELLHHWVVEFEELWIDLCWLQESPLPSVTACNTDLNGGGCGIDVPPR